MRPAEGPLHLKVALEYARSSIAGNVYSFALTQCDPIQGEKSLSISRDIHVVHILSSSVIMKRYARYLNIICGVICHHAKQARDAAQILQRY
jgi:hypothetical protein